MASNRIEIVSEIKALEKFCAFPASLVGEERERFMRDYLADIQDFPIDAIRKACADWRKSGSTKFPTTGQLIPIIERHIRSEKPEQNGPWQPITEEDYEAMPLSAKIRHRMILAHEARVTASTKTHGWDRNIKTAPPAYLHWQSIAEDHEAEAIKLRKIMQASRTLAPA